jgi:hypothetical protein
MKATCRLVQIAVSREDVLYALDAEGFVWRLEHPTGDPDTCGNVYWYFVGAPEYSDGEDDEPVTNE